MTKMSQIFKYYTRKFPFFIYTKPFLKNKSPFLLKVEPLRYLLFFDISSSKNLHLYFIQKTRL